MALAGVHVSGRSSPNSENQPPTANLIDIDSLNTKLNNNLLFVPTSPVNEVNQIIFNSQINQKQWEKVQEEGICDEEVQLLPNRVRETPSDDPVSFTVIFQMLAFFFIFVMTILLLASACNIIAAIC